MTPLKTFTGARISGGFRPRQLHHRHPGRTGRVDDDERPLGVVSTMDVVASLLNAISDINEGEGQVDTDGDGLPDQRPPTGEPFFDRDGDGLPDTRACQLAPRSIRISIDSDEDGLPDTRVR